MANNEIETNGMRLQLIKCIDDYLDIDCERDFMSAFGQLACSKDVTVESVGIFMWCVSCAEYPDFRTASCFRQLLLNIRKMLCEGNALSKTEIENLVLGDVGVRKLFYESEKFEKEVRIIIFLVVTLIILVLGCLIWLL